MYSVNSIAIFDMEVNAATNYKASKMPPPTTLSRISQERCNLLQSYFTASPTTMYLTQVLDITSLGVSGVLQNVIEYCLKVHKTEPAIASSQFGIQARSPSLTCRMSAALFLLFRQLVDFLLQNQLVPKVVSGLR